MDISLGMKEMEVVLLMMFVMTAVFIVLTTNAKMGILGMAAGLVLGIVTVGVAQNEEAHPWQYEQLNSMRGQNCRIDEAMRKANADSRITLIEYNRISDLEDEINLKSARDALAEKPTVKCRS